MKVNQINYGGDLGIEYIKENKMFRFWFVIQIVCSKNNTDLGSETKDRSKTKDVDEVINII